MVTEKEYLKAVNVIIKYRDQKKEELKLLEKQMEDLSLKTKTMHELACDGLISFRLRNITRTIYNPNLNNEDRWKNYDDIETLEDVARYKKSTWARERGMGKKMLEELETLLNRRGLEFSKVDRYKTK